MHFKLLALFAFATAAIAAPASEDTTVDVINTESGATSHSFPGTRVNTEVRGIAEPYEKSYYEPPHYQDQPTDKCAPQCCQLIPALSSGADEGFLSAGGILKDEKAINLGTSTGSFEVSCQTIISTCPTVPVCCSQTYSAGSFHMKCVPVIVEK